jgi:hypothetical protein
MNTVGSRQGTQVKKKKTSAGLGLFIVVLLIGISVGLYLLTTPAIFNPRAATDTFARCGPSGQCNAYGWNNNNGYTKVPDNCYIALYKCKVTDWNKALAVGCQKNTSNQSRNLAYYAEIHKKTSSNPNPKIWDKVVSGSKNGFLNSFAPPQMCGVWQIDVGPSCKFSFHSGGNRKDSMCKTTAKETHNVCDGMACKKVNGPGKNECVNAGTNPALQCSHRKCENNKCVLVAGGNIDDKCKVDSDCSKSPTPTPTSTPNKCLGVPIVTDVKISCPLCK